jgi:hypothetical protein
MRPIEGTSSSYRQNKGRTFLTHSGGSLPTDHHPDNALDNRHPAPPREQFRLTGHSAELDTSTNAVRGDLADVDLADRVFAPHYARAVAWQAKAETVIRLKPVADAAAVGKLMVGDVFNVLDFSAGWAWGRTAFAVGYVPADTIVP